MGADETLPEKVPRQRELMLSCLTTIERKYSGTQSERSEEVPELEQWDGKFWGPNREFFSKNREFSAKIESSTSGLGSHSKIRGQVTPTSRRPHLRHAPTLPHDRSTARPGRFPSSRHCWRPRAFHPAAQPLIGRPLPISPGGTPHSLPPG